MRAVVEGVRGPSANVCVVRDSVACDMGCRYLDDGHSGSLFSSKCGTRSVV